MPVPNLLVLAAVFFLTSIVSVVTGATSLVTVPVMIALGLEPHIAVATSMCSDLPQRGRINSILAERNGVAP
jgi:uncharacterized membrane protein YfcA